VWIVGPARPGYGTLSAVARSRRSLTELVGLQEVCRMAGVPVWLDDQGIVTATENGMSLLDMRA